MTATWRVIHAGRWRWRKSMITSEQPRVTATEAEAAAPTIIMDAPAVPAEPDDLSGGISLGESIRVALSSLMANKLRTLLTSLGVIIGVMAVVALLAIGRGSQETITAAITANGTNLLTVRPGAPNSGGFRGEVGSAQTLTMQDAQALADPANVAATLFPDGSAVNQPLKIRGLGFHVVGVLNAQGGSGFGSVDDSVVVPISTAQRKLFGGRAVTSGGGFLVATIVVQAHDQKSIPDALDQITQTLRQRHQLPPSGSGDDFSVINQQDILNTAVQTTQVLTLFLGAIAAISLLVGGIGIMNIMLVSVRERTREIGLRKALGARERDVLVQFLIEALTLSTAGGVIGLALGAAIAMGVNHSGIVRASVSIDSVVLAIGFAMAVGLFFGIEPARRAARLDPIVALRYE